MGMVSLGEAVVMITPDSADVWALAGFQSKLEICRDHGEAWRLYPIDPRTEKRPGSNMPKVMPVLFAISEEGYIRLV
jgi:hypothetical protein